MPLNPGDPGGTQNPPLPGVPAYVPQKYRAYVADAAGAAGLPPSVVAAQIQLESDWNPQAVSPTGAQGIAQFEPGTWATWGNGSPFNVGDAFTAYAKYMASLLTQENGSVRNALAAYNAGPGNLSAGYGYADEILANAGQSGSLTGTPPGSTVIGGQVPSGGGWLSDVDSAVMGVLSQLGAGGSALAKFIGSLGPGGGLGALIGGLIEILDWTLHPSNWIRLFCGVAGTVLVLAGIWQLTHAGAA